MKLIVIDVQKGVTDQRLYDYEGFIEKAQRLINAARENGVEVIYVQHDDGPGTGFSVGDTDFEIADQVAPLPGERIFVKSVNSIFGSKELTTYLQIAGDETLMLIGLQTDFCIDASVKTAFDRGFKVIVPKGANSTFDNDYMDKETTYKYFNDMMWPDRYAKCVSVEEAIEILRQERGSR